MTEEMKIEKGSVLHTSWGYDMTINDFCIVLEVSPTGKSVLCQMIGSVLVDGDNMQGSVKPNINGSRFGKPFRLRVRENSAVGSYPYCVKSVADADNDKRRGFFTPVKNDRTFYENHLD